MRWRTLLTDAFLFKKPYPFKPPGKATPMGDVDLGHNESEFYIAIEENPMVG
jgi:hypothetical protein